MRMSAFAAVCSAALLASIPAYAAPPVEAFGSLPQVSDMKLSPDGHHIAAIQPIAGRPAVVVFAFTPAGVKQYAFAVNDATAEHVEWAGNDRVIAVFQENAKMRFDTELRNWQRAFAITAEAKNPVRLMGDSVIGSYNVRTGGVVDMSPDDPSHAYMEALEAYARGDPDTRLHRGAITLNVFRVDLTDGSAKPAEIGDDQTIQWVMDGHGHAVARVEQDINLRDTLLVGGGSHWQEALSFDGAKGGDADVLGLMQDGTAIAMARPDQSGMLSLYAFPLSGQSPREPLFSNPQFDVVGVRRDDWTRRVIGVTYADDKMEYRYFDPTWQQVQARLEAALPGQTVRIESADVAKDAYIVRSSGPQQPPIYQLFDPRTSQLTFLAAEYPSLSTSDLGEVRPYPYKARDGLQIHAYLTVPPGKSAHNLPTVVFPHGGPEVRDVMDFDWWAQFMASRGYAVLQPNFRGSSGYGAKFRDAGNGQWGHAMQDDITDGVKKLIADGIADPKRICIVGASYGGYAALAGATFTPDLYACAVAYAPVSDLPTMLGKEASQHGQNSDVLSYWQTRIGDRFMDEKRLEAVSPARHANEVKAPILLVHSDKDVTVPLKQSEMEADALKRAGKTVEFVTLEGDDHYLEFADTRTGLLKKIERFLAAHIGSPAAESAKPGG